MVSMTVFQVEPFASLATLPGISVPRLLLNRELVGPFKHRRKRPTDVARTGELVESVEGLVRSAGWEGNLRRLQGCDAEGEEEGGNDESAVSFQLPEVEGVFETPVLEPSGGRRGGGREGMEELEVAMAGLSVKDGVEREGEGRDGVEDKGVHMRGQRVICEDSLCGDEGEEKGKTQWNKEKTKPH